MGPLNNEKPFLKKWTLHAELPLTLVVNGRYTLSGRYATSDRYTIGHQFR